MESETRDGPGGDGPRESGHDDGHDGSEAERLRRENRRLEARLAAERRRRERLIDRYEALVPDGSEPGAGDERASGPEGGAGRAGRLDRRRRPVAAGVRSAAARLRRAVVSLYRTAVRLRR